MKSKIKWAALGGLVLSFMSLLAHLFLAKSSASMLQYSSIAAFTEDLNYPEKPGRKGAGYRKLWGKVKAMEALQPYANTRSMPYPCNFPYMFLLGIATSLTVFQSLISNMSPLTDNHVLSASVSQLPHEQNNGFIYAKVHGDFEKIKASICDLVAISRLLNATLVIPEIQGSTQSKGISSKFRSFSYLYNEEQFISVLANDVIIARNLPHDLMETRKRKQYPIFKPKRLSSPNYYLQDVLPKLKSAKVIGLILTDGGCLQSILPSSLVEYQSLRCRVAYHALHFREEIVEVGNQIVQRTRCYPNLRIKNIASAVTSFQIS
ncbi:protein EMBRYO SAC DEVELOPMENT ARREST 30-like isoform X3 [Primulina eburnea]|uniref:protein EMBRYO SAC DEVELOPMENT ARREST 30-like isoform X3 n=1 Tax=Primulina eburnea TaxID=1245227 RepID=UPI003C6C79C7